MSTPRLDTLSYEQLCELSTQVETQKAKAYKAAETDRNRMRGMLDKMLSTLQATPSVIAAATAQQPTQAKTATKPATIQAPQVTPAQPITNGKHKRKASPQKGKKAPVKFRSGKHTWSGRGKTPAWLQTLEKAGQPRSQFAV